MRFALEIVERVRVRIGPDLMIVFALSGSELVEAVCLSKKAPSSLAR